MGWAVRKYGVACVAILACCGIWGPSNAQTVSPDANLRDLIMQYRAATDLVRPNIARQIDRASRNIAKTPETAAIRAQALTTLSNQAARVQRKDFALKSAREATSLSANLTGSDAKAIRARAAIATSHALTLKRDFLEASRTIVAARLAYGPLVTDTDIVWDELLLWQTIAKASAPQFLADQIEALSLSDEAAGALFGAKAQLCGDSITGFERNPEVGLEPVYPVMSLFSELQGGVVMRSQLGVDGKVISTRATAFAPTDGFAAAAENAVPTWSYKVPADTPARCRENVLTLLAFKIG